MKLTHFLMMTLVAVLLAGCVEQNVTVTVQPGGASVANMEVLMPRKLAEQQVRQQEAAENGGQQGEQAGEPKPIADSELIEHLKEHSADQWLNQFPGGTPSLDKVEVQDEKVRMQGSVKFNALADFVGASPSFFGEYGFAGLVVDTNETGQLRMTFSVQPAAKFRKQQLKQMQTIKFKGQLKFVLPGKIVSSSFPETKDNTTWLTIDPDKPETYAALEKLQEKPVVIVAEMGGLKVPEALHSDKLMMLQRAHTPGEPDLPVTEAGPGFQTEAINLTANTRYVFPGAEKNYSETYGQEPNQLMVQAKLFAPKGRTIRMLGQVTVQKAVDDKGRSLVLTNADTINMPGSFMSMGGNGEDAGQSTPIQIRLKLPETDAKAVEEVNGEVVATTVGKWKELSITDLKGDASKTNDLGTILPGAKLVILKSKQNGQQGNYSLEITGPTEVRQLDFQMVGPSTPMPGMGNNTRAMNDNSQVKNGQTVRRVALMYFGFDPQAGGPVLPKGMKVRMPEDLKRERVKILLKGIDLY